MNKIWVGDFRLKDIKAVLSDLQLEGDDDKYFFDDSAEFCWFNTVATNQFVAELSEKSAVIFMIGFNDCVNSCIWSNFDIVSYADKYATAINNVIEQHRDIDFYLCSVNPVELDYHLAVTTITAKDLNDKIDVFNSTIRAKCSSATYIDSNAYLKDVGFTTRDGVRFDFSSSKTIAHYVISSIKTVVSTSSTTFRSRLSAPSAGTYTSGGTTEQGTGLDYWRSTSKGGLNPFGGLSGHTGGKYDGDTLPNCTAYAWGRFYEILGSRPKLSTGNAEDWYGYTADGYERGNTPSLGAIICWEGKGSAAGHVAVVEKINDDGSIVTSESGWNSSAYWWLTDRTNSNGNWGASSNYVFQGFIYSPTEVVTPNAGVISVKKSDVTSHTGITTTKERETNALYIYKYLSNCGWTINAIAALLGNLEHESWINPGVTEIGGFGFGLVQWTPPSKFTKWCDAQNPPLSHTDVDSQLARIEHERDHNNGTCTPSGCGCGQYFYRTHDYYYDKYLNTYTPKTFNEFATSTRSPYELACAFLYNYECPGSICFGAYDTDKEKAVDIGRRKTPEEREKTRAATRETRGKCAEKWYKFLAPYSTVEQFQDESAVLENLLVKFDSTTAITASFIIKNGTSYKYSILQDGTALVENTVELDQADTELKTESFTYTGMIPNKEYTIEVELTDKSAAVLTETLKITMPQDFPDAVKSISFTCNSDYVDINSSFNLKVSQPKSLGYWKSSSGYDIQLFVNGKLVNTKTDSVKDIDKNFTIKDEFGYECKLGDTVQIGVRTWVKDSNKKIIYNKKAAGIVSKPICILNNPVQAFITT